MKDLSEYVGYKFKKGSKIHIKKSHEGLFTKKAQSAGMGVQEYARHVLANKDNYDSATVKQAVFAQNFGGLSHRKAQKHFNGGVLRNNRYIVGGVYNLTKSEIDYLKQRGYGIEII